MASPLDKLARLLSKLDGRDTPPTEWLRTGWPRAVPIALLVALPLAIAGPIRFVMHASPMLALLLGLVVAAVAVMPFVRALRVGELARGESIAANAVVVIAGAFCLWLLYNGSFGGLVSYHARDGMMAIDAASHVRLYHTFTERTPDVYEGFVSLYGFWDPLRRISGDLITAAKLTYLFGGFVVAAVPCVIAFSVLRKFRANRRAYLAGAGACLVASIAMQYLVILPVVTFHHMAGFWGHVFGLVPLVSLWLVDALVRQRILRIASVLFVAAIYRYTYGLNLPDVLFAVGAVLVIEALGDLPTRTKIACTIAAVGTIAAAVFSYAQLVPMLKDWGWIVKHDPPRVLQGQALAVVALLATACWAPPAVTRGSGIVRALRFPFLFVAANIALLLVNKQFTSTSHYYYQKYSFHAVVLLASSVIVVAAFWAATCAAKLDRRAIIGVLVVAALVGASTWRIRRGFRAYQEGFHEYVAGPPYKRAQPWYDRGAVDKIREVLADNHKAFGGYMATWWPMRSFTNALFDNAASFWELNIDYTPGHCIFWEADQFLLYDLDPTKQCATYEQRWSATHTGSLCWRCY